MGPNISNLTNSENYNQIQITQTNQTCNTSAYGIISDDQIVAIDSHIGNIDFSTNVTIGDMDCILTSVTQQNIKNVVDNSNDSQITALPFSATLGNDITQANITNFNSFQQALTSQTCKETAIAEVTRTSLTFIDSTTGDIKISATNAVNDFSCNLTSSTYQSAATSVTDKNKSSISVGCCSCGLAAIFPFIIGIVGVALLSKFMKKDSPADNQYQNSLSELLGINQVYGTMFGKSPPTAQTRSKSGSASSLFRLGGKTGRLIGMTPEGREIKFVSRIASKKE